MPGGEVGFELETNRDVNDPRDLTALIAAVNGPIDTFVADAETELDLDGVLVLGAAEAWIGDWDGYFMGANNYLLYDDLGSGLHTIFPWGIDQSFMDPSFDVYGSTGAPDGLVRRNGWIFMRCKESPACLARYEAAVQSVVDAFSALDVEAEMDRILDQTAQAIADDTRRWYEDDWMIVQQDRFRGFIRARAAAVQAQLDGPLPELCGNGLDDDGDGSFDCDDADCAAVRCSL